MRHTAVSKSPCKLGKDFNKCIWALSVLKRIQESCCSTRCSALCQKITQTSAQCQICNQRNDQKTDQHQCSLYKVSYAYSHKSPHKCIAENDCCTNCQSYMIINSKYCVKKFTACCQCRSCINQEKDYDHDG